MNRDYHLFKELYQQLLKKVRKRVGFSKLRVIDTTTEGVEKIVFSLWPYKRDKGVVRIGVVYDPHFELPETINISDGKMPDQIHGKKFRFKKGLTYPLDRGFWDYTLYAKLIKRQAYLIARLQKTTVYKSLKALKITQPDVISDEIVYLGNPKDKFEIKKHKVRIIKCLDNKQKEVVWFLTNKFDLSTQEVRELYRRRWDIEVFFMPSSALNLQRNATEPTSSIAIAAGGRDWCFCAVSTRALGANSTATNLEGPG